MVAQATRAKADLNILQEIQLISTIGWRSTDLSSQMGSESIHGQSYRFAVYGSILSNIIYTGVSYDRSQLYNNDASRSSMSSETAFLLKLGFNPRKDWRADFGYRHLVLGNMQMQSLDQQSENVQVYGGRFGLNIEWTGMLGLGIIAGAEMAAQNLRLKSSGSESWQINSEHEFYVGGIARF